VKGWNSNYDMPRRWIKALSVLSVALTVNVVILTVYIFIWTEPQGASASSSSTNTFTGTAAPGINQKWAPLPDSKEVLTSIAFGSCNSQYMPQAHWDTLAKFNPDLVVLTGDNVYGDCKNETCATLKQAYDDWAAHPSFAGAKSILPVVATLDDHDYGQGDCHANNPYKDVAKKMFLDFFDIHDERRTRTDDGVYHSYKWGSGDQIVQLILLDTRYSRSPFLKSDEPGVKGKEAYMPDSYDGGTQMLSPKQWSWLEDQLAEDANVRIIVSSIQVLSDAHGFECWRMLPHERGRLERLIMDKAMPNSATVLVSGDRHVGGIYETQGGVIEMTASSWTHTIPFGAYDDCNSVQSCDEYDIMRLDDLVRSNNFGSVDIDWENRALTLSLRMADGTAAYRYHETGDQKTDAGSVIQKHSYIIP
jgi:alkaline phosphatase D